MERGAIFGEADARAFVQQCGASRPALGGQLLVGADVAGWLMAPPESRLARLDRIEWEARDAYREGGADFEFMPPELTEPAQPRIHVFFAAQDADGSYEVPLSLTTRVPERVTRVLVESLRRLDVRPRSKLVASDPATAQSCTSGPSPEPKPRSSACRSPAAASRR